MNFVSLISIVMATIALAGCVTSGELPPVPEKYNSAKMRGEIASAVLRTAPRGWGWTKVVKAEISTPYQSRKFGTGEPYTQYCVTAAVEMPIWDKYFYSDVEVYETADGGNRIKVRTTNNPSCPGGFDKPFPELEAASLTDPVALKANSRN
jgi:hypothetical protein